MGNEMGNRNINGLQVSEQENNETTEVMDQSPNASFLSLNGLDGLKGVSEYLADDSKNSEEDGANNLATDKFSEPLAVFSDVEEASQSNSERENQALEKEDTKLLAYDESSMLDVSDTKYTDLASTEYPEEDDSLLQRTIPEGTASEKEDSKLLAYGESSDVSDTKHTDLESTGSPEEDKNLLQRTIPEETEKQEDHKDAADESLENSIVSMDKEDQIDLISPREHQDQALYNKGSKRDSGDQDSEKKPADKSLEDSVVPKDGEIPTPLIDHNDLHEKLSDSAQTGSDGSLIQKQILERKVVQETNGKDNEFEDVLVERKIYTASALDEQRPDEPIHAAYQDIIDSEISKLAVYPDTITVVQETNSEDYELKDELINRKSSVASLLEEQRPDEEINAAHVDATNSERNDLDEVGKQSKTEPNGFQGILDYDKEAYGGDDSENDSFDIHLNAIGPCKEENEEDVGSDAVFELAIQTCYLPPETNVVEMGNPTLQMDTYVADGEHEKYDISTEVESESPDGELNAQFEVADDITTSDALTDQTTVEELVQKCGAMEDGALENKEELFAIDIIQENPSGITFNSDFKPENEKQVQDIINLSMNKLMTDKKEEAFIPTDSAWCLPILDSEALEGQGSSFDVNSDGSVIESVKCVTYEYEKNSHEAENTVITEESKQKSPFDHESYKSKPLEVSGIDIREYRVSTSNEDINKVSDKSPLLCQRKSEESRESTERMPFSDFMKQEGTVVDSAEKEEVLLLKKTAKESLQIPSNKSTTTSSTSREKQKPRSSLFGSCMCCTTAIN